MLYDTLTYSGAEKSLKDWGFSLDSCNLVIKNQSPDTFRATIAGGSILDDAVFAFEGQVILRSGCASVDGTPNSFSSGTVEFAGKRVGQPMRADSTGKGVTYEFQNAWYDLEHVNFLNSYKGYDGTVYSLAEVVLNTIVWAGPGTFTDVYGTVVPANSLGYVTTGQQINAILQFLLDIYTAQSMAAPYAIGTIDPFLVMPSIISKPLMCADALITELGLSPRTTVWFDYTYVDHSTRGGSPPKVNVNFTDNFTSATMPLFQRTSSPFNKLANIQPRPELQARAVVVSYKIVATVDGSQVISYVTDKWGPNGHNSGSDPATGLRVLNEVVNLQGFNATTVKGTVVVEPLACQGGSQATKRAWWADKQGGEFTALEDYKVRFQDDAASPAATTIPDAEIYDVVGAAVLAGADLTTYAYRVVHGTVHPWMKESTGDAALVKKCRIKAAMEFSTYEASGSSDTDTTGHRLSHTKHGDHSVSVELTNVDVSGDQTAIASYTPGESYILGGPTDATLAGLGQSWWQYTAGYTGIAWYLYHALSKLQYDGDYVLVEASFSGGVSMANRLNLSGGRTEWLTMDAQIQEITKNFGRHTTSVKIGVAKHLSAGDLSSLLQTLRVRQPWYNPALRADPTLGSGNTITMPQAAGNANTTEGADSKTIASVLSIADGSGNKIKASQDVSDPSKPFISLQTFDSSSTPVLQDMETDLQIKLAYEDLIGTNKKVKFRAMCVNDNGVKKTSYIPCTLPE